MSRSNVPLPIFKVLSILLVAVVAGCTAVLDVTSYGFAQAHTNTLVEGAGFKHRVVSKKGTGTRLHVYIDGDGRPWETRIKRAENPSPERVLALELMALDTHPTLFLGRPCYFVSNDSRCDNDKWWTSHRYSQEVVHSMSAVIDKYAGDYDSIVLMGHSGGGAIAFLLASQRDDVSALVTLAANLNTTLWTQQHRFAPLYGSLNPASAQPLDAAVGQYHFLGEQDTNVSPRVVSSIADKQTNAVFEILPGLDHSCCWTQAWPGILDRSGLAD